MNKNAKKLILPQLICKKKNYSFSKQTLNVGLLKTFEGL